VATDIDFVIACDFSFSLGESDLLFQDGFKLP